MINTYKATFSVEGNWAECNGVRVETSGADTGRQLCRAMVAAGFDDGSLAMCDEQGMLCYTYNSMHHSAKFMLVGLNLVPYDSMPVTANTSTGISPSVFATLQRIKNGEWDDLHHFSKNAAKPYVTITEDGVVVNDVGEAAIASYNNAPVAVKEKAPKDPNKVLLTTSQIAAFKIVATGKKSAWEKLHGKTTNLMIGKGWVKIEKSRPVITEIGQSIYAMHA